MQPIIKIENLSKIYRLGQIGTGTLNHDFKRWLYRIRGKEDPYLKIGETNDRSIKGSSEYIWALKDINLEVMPGEVLGIIGKNGAGKSTLLKILSKVTGPTTGSIKYNGRIGSLLEVGTGFHQELTGRENIFLNGAILGMTKAEIKTKLDEIVDFSGVERFIDTPVKRYSSGMMVRLGFAVAAHLEPEILVVDEVLSVGDAEFQKKAIGKMQNVSQNEGRTVLFVSHNMASIRSLCNVGLLMINGSIKSYGEVNSICTEYLSENLAEDLISEEDFEDNDSAFRTLSIKLKNTEGKVTNTFECEEEIIIEIRCRLKEKIPGLYGYLDIRKIDGTIVWVTDSNDYNVNKLEQLKLGESFILLKVPPRTLGVGVFNLALAFNSEFNISGFYADNPGIVCRFEVNDNSTNRGNQRGGFFSTLIDWRLE